MCTSSSGTMFFLMSLFTLLIVAPGLLVSAENVITCDGGPVQHLNCETGLINVESATFGRTDSSVCTTDRPPSQIVNDTCSSNVSIVSTRCNGQKQCEFRSDGSLGIPDPCYGTYKYYNTTYTCIPGRLSVTCEEGYSTLDCGNGVIQVINANFGRIDSRTCSERRPANEISNTNCYTPNTLSTVSAWCNGNSSCTVQASYAIFPDTCYGTYKYLTVSYFCLTVHESVTCEHSNAVLSCESGSVLKIHSTNYGRTDSTTCSSGRPTSQITKTNCYASSSLAEVQKRCQDKPNCVVPASNSVFTDPCYGTYKYLTINYACVV